jgi:HK97 family phage portal protein
MSIWSRIFGGGRQKDDSSSIENWFREFGDQRTASGIAVNQQTAMQVTTVLACVRVRSQDVAKLPPHIYRLGTGGKRVEATDHFLYSIFRRPNDWQTWMEFCEQMQVAMLLRGNAYAVVLRNLRGKPVGMVPVNPANVSIWEAPGGQIFYQVVRIDLHLRAVLKDFPLMIPSDDIFHLRWASSNSLIGLSPIGLCAEAIGLAKGQERLAANLMGNGARPSGVLSTDKRLSDTAFKRLKSQWNTMHGGVENTGKTLVAEEGLKWNALTLSSVDLEFIAGRKLQVDEICRIFGVSPAKVGVFDSGVARGLDQIQLAHYTDAVHPDLVRWEQKLLFYFELGTDLEIYFDESELLRADMVARANAARVLQVSGIAMPNESRASFRLDPYPGGDVLLVPNNVVPLHLVGQKPGPGPGSDQTGATGDGGSGDPTQIDGADDPAQIDAPAGS